MAVDIQQQQRVTEDEFMAFIERPENSDTIFELIEGKIVEVSSNPYARQPEVAHKGYNPNPPELAVEVISDTDSADEARRLRLKLSNYLAAGTVVWVVNTDNRTVEVHHPAQGAQVIRTDGTLTLEAILPGFSLAVASIFPTKQDER